MIKIEVIPERQTIDANRLRLARMSAGRSRSGYSTTEMGKRMGKSQSWISSVEHGKASITAAQVALWARVTSVSSDYLYGKGPTIGGS
jgi:transcriptional regulator with XRE-family HTH domain